LQSKTDLQTRNLFRLADGGVTTVDRVLPPSRGNENEADRMGVIYAVKAGYDPRAAIRFWQKMAKQK
jgi:predicted Zn-dependent protease